MSVDNYYTDDNSGPLLSVLSEDKSIAPVREDGNKENGPAVRESSLVGALKESAPKCFPEKISITASPGSDDSSITRLSPDVGMKRFSQSIPKTETDAVLSGGRPNVANKGAFQTSITCTQF